MHIAKLTAWLCVTHSAHCIMHNGLCNLYLTITFPTKTEDPRRITISDPKVVFD